VEEQLVEVEGALLKYHLGVPVPDGIGVYVSYPEISFPMSLREKREAQKLEIEIGITNPARIIEAEKGISYEEAVAEYQENMNLLNPPVPIVASDETQD
jgi:hypothetical protein